MSENELGEAGDAEPRPRRFLRPAGLFLLTVATVVFAPMVLVGVPFILLAALLPGPGALALIAAGVFLVSVMVPGATDGVWYLERGWALLVGGWFVALTWRWPGSRFTHRGLAAVAAALLVLAGYFALNPDTWALVDWVVRNKVGGDLAAFVEGLRTIADVDPSLIATFDRFFESQVRLYPSLIALSSFFALGVAWWLYMRLSHHRDDGLGALGQFGFPDGLIWVAIAGVSLVLIGRAGASLVGYNTLLFMGALYALRGVAVVVFFKGTVTFGGILLAGLFTLLAAPLVVGAAVLIGLGDTWLSLRERAEAAGDPG